MNKEIKALLKNEEGSLKINDFCTLKFYKKDGLGGDNNGAGYLSVEFKSPYGKSWRSYFIESREPEEIKQIIKEKQTEFFDKLRDMLNRQIDSGYIG